MGIEPYTQANEYYADGGNYGAVAEGFRNAIRARATSTNDQMATIKLGLTSGPYAPLDDLSGYNWFKPRLDAVSNNLSDFSYMDMYHLYGTGDVESETTRLLATTVNTNGFQYWWCTAPWPTNWQADFGRQLYWYDDVYAAFRDYASQSGWANSNSFADSWRLGCAEHGLAGSTAFDALDMNAGLHWAFWLAEVMRYQAAWDMNWVLCDEGFSSPQLQFYGTNLTLTPAHYVYKMAQEFSGLRYVTNTFADGLFSLDSSGPLIANTSMNNRDCLDTSETTYDTSPDAVVRVFSNPTNGDYHLFVVNQNASTNATITGWSNWIVSGWEQLASTNYYDSNEFGTSDNHLHTTNLTHVTAQSLVVPAISINHIVLSSNLINVQFGAPATPMTGMAALGSGANDYWNLLQKDYPGNHPPYNWGQLGDPYFGTNCLTYRSNDIGDFAVALYCSDTNDIVDGGIWSGQTNLPFASFFATQGGSDFQIDVLMPVGIYDVYLYSAYFYDGGYLPVSFSYNGVNKSVATNNYSLSALVENNQYVVFRDLTFTNAGTATFNVHSDLEPIVNGMQILMH